MQTSGALAPALPLSSGRALLDCGDAILKSWPEF
jgi:hypothetical protein